MTNDDQIRDEKLQFDINREAAKISALSSGKIDKYEYLAGEEILPSNKQKMIEQAKFTYSPLGKAFEKQIKTIEDQGEKQAKALKDLKPKQQTKALESESISKDIFYQILEEKIDEIVNMSREITSNNLIYKFKTLGISSINFIKFKGPMYIYNKLKNGVITLSQAEEDQKIFKMELNQITSENPEYKS